MAKVMILQISQCPVCRIKDTGINGKFFLADGKFCCLNCGGEFTEEEVKESASA